MTRVRDRYFIVLLAGIAGCASTTHPQCYTDTDCKGSRICIDGSCADAPGAGDGGATPQDLAVSRASDGSASPDLSQGGDLAQAADLQSEVDLATPPDLYMPTCNDNVKNGQETDVDCGGNCPACANGKACGGNGDCTSGLCVAGTCRAVPNCHDGIQNQNETDVDCGGVCPACADGKHCQVNPDCTSMQCQNNVCTPNGPQMLAACADHSFAMALDATFVYWVDDTAAGGLYRVAKGGGNVATLAQNLAEPTAVVVDASFAYVLERNNGSNGRIDRIPINGGAAQLIVSGLRNSQNELAQDASFLYYGDVAQMGGGLIQKVSKAPNSPATTLVSGNGLLNLQTAVAADSGSVYFCNDNRQALSVSKNGGNPTVLGNLPGGCAALKVFGSSLYFADYGNSQIGVIPTSGGNPLIIAPNLGISPSMLDTDGVSVYWIGNSYPGTPGKAPAGGGAVTKIDMLGDSNGIAVDDTSVYWIRAASLGQCQILKAKK